MKLTAFKRIIVEEFDKEDQASVSKLANLINPIIDQFAILFDKRIDFINTNRQLKVLTLKVNASGKPINSIQIKSELKTKAAGTNVIRVINTDNVSNIVTSQPFIDFVESEGIITINNISGLAANTNYTVSIEIIGQNTG